MTGDLGGRPRHRLRARFASLDLANTQLLFLYHAVVVVTECERGRMREVKTKGGRRLAKASWPCPKWGLAVGH